VVDVRPAARGFDLAADAYQRARPSYPRATLTRLQAGLGLEPGRVVADVGAGTGKLTHALVASGADVVAVEPSPGMREVLRRELPAVPVLAAGAESVPLPDASFDAIAVAQAMHWFDAPRALTEFARLLVPTGQLAVVFNRRDLEDPLQRELDDLLAPYRGDTPSWADHSWVEPLDDPEAGAPFRAARHTDEPHEQRLDLAGLVDRVGSVSFVAAMPAHDRDAILTQVRAIGRRYLTGDGIRLPYRCELRLLERR
jgi:SAM-dependent methyltransferase